MDALARQPAGRELAASPVLDFGFGTTAAAAAAVVSVVLAHLGALAAADAPAASDAGASCAELLATCLGFALSWRRLDAAGAPSLGTLHGTGTLVLPHGICIQVLSSMAAGASHKVSNHRALGFTCVPT